MELRHQILLSGPPGVGKTTVGRELATLLHLPFLDLDERVESTGGATPAKILVREGEAEFRRMERTTLASVYREPAVIALGGGTLVELTARVEARSRGLLMGLHAAPDILRARIEHDRRTERPLLRQQENPTGRLQELLEARAQSYASVDRTFSAEGAPMEVASRISDAARQMRVRSCRLAEHQTRIVIGRELESALLGCLSHHSPSRAVIVLSDAGVPSVKVQRYTEPLASAFQVWQRVLPGGEACKTWSVLEEVLEGALAAGAGRQSVVVALGGGAICDLAGVVASLLGRGARLVLVPTTVLAQADASVGGKCAINTRAGRNLVGAFHPAEDVVVDLDFLASLSDEEHHSGLVEVLKMGLLRDPGLFRRVASTRRAELETMDRAIELKSEFVERDPWDTGDRMLLNLGHTVGHALEAGSNYTLRHGTAVAWGIRAVARLSREQAGLSAADEAEITEAITPFLSYPTLPQEVWSRALPYLRRDKKGDLQGVELILLQKIGEATRRRVSWSQVEDTWMSIGGSSK